jgi:hypothetical protein
MTRSADPVSDKKAIRFSLMVSYLSAQRARCQTERNFLPLENASTNTSNYTYNKPRVLNKARTQHGCSNVCTRADRSSHAAAWSANTARMAHTSLVNFPFDSDDYRFRSLGSKGGGGRKQMTAICSIRPHAAAAQVLFIVERGSWLVGWVGPP